MLGMRSKPQPTTYRVELVISTGSYFPYSGKEGIELSMATSLATGLKRQQSAGRVVELPSGKVVDEWDNRETKTSPSSTVRDRVQALREKFSPEQS